MHTDLSSEQNGGEREKSFATNASNVLAIASITNMPQWEPIQWLPSTSNANNIQHTW
jgi:hypothetical protein